MPREPYSVRIPHPHLLGGALRRVLIFSFPEFQSWQSARRPWRRPVPSGRDPEITARRKADGWVVEERLPWEDFSPVSIRQAAADSGISYPTMRALYQGTATRMTVKTYDRLESYLDKLHDRAVDALGSSPPDERRVFNALVSSLMRVLCDLEYPKTKALRAGRAHTKRVAAKAGRGRPA